MKCPRCGAELVRRHGKYGDFYGCSNFPDCRYTQDTLHESNYEYGHSTEIQEIICKDGKWSVIPVRRMESPHPILKLGFHTFNNYQGLIVIDAKGFRYPILGKILKSFSAKIKGML